MNDWMLMQAIDYLLVIINGILTVIICISITTQWPVNGTNFFQLPTISVVSTFHHLGHPISDI